MIKHILKNALNSLGYTITKKPTEESLLLEFYYKNGWLKVYNIKSILDIGANEGQFAQKISAIFPEAAMHCFEPLAEPFSILRKNLSNRSNTQFYQLALGDVDEELAMHENEFSPASSFLTIDSAHTKNFAYAVATKSSSVKVRKLDGLALILKENTLIKIDVQGFEDKVIAGGAETIKRAAVVIIEVSFKKLYSNQPLFHDIYNTLHSWGFSYHGNLEQLLSPSTNEILQADAIFVRDNE